MRFFELLEARDTHHDLTDWRRVHNRYELAYDTHAIARAGERGVTTRIMSGMLLFVFHYDIVQQIPRGTSTYIHDSNSGCSIVLERLRSYPFRFIVRTMMGPEYPPGKPCIDIQVPEISHKPTPEERIRDQQLKHLGTVARDRGVDAASQIVKSGEDGVPLNREQRRALEKNKRRNR